jgi:arylsulfatase A-like enzyme
MPGADIGLRPEDPTIATALKHNGYRTGQFGKNHLGDRDEFLPTNHGFDEFFGNLYHLNAEEEPELRGLPDPEEDFPNFRKNFGPRGVIHSYADGRIEDTGPLTRKRMETIDDEILVHAQRFIGEANGPTSRSSCGSTPPTCTSGPTPSPRAAARPAGGSPSTTTR